MQTSTVPKPRAYMAVKPDGSGRLTQNPSVARTWRTNGGNVLELYDHPGAPADVEVGYLKQQLETLQARHDELVATDSERLQKVVAARNEAHSLRQELNQLRALQAVPA